MKRKVDQIRDAWNTGDQIAALRIAARLFDRSATTKIFQLGITAHNHPGFYRRLGKPPEQIVADSLVVLARRFGLN